MTSPEPPVGTLREVDARYLEPPEPFVRAMEAIDTLQDGERIRLLLFREPYPLYRVLDENGFARNVELLADGTFAILIWKRQSPP